MSSLPVIADVDESVILAEIKRGGTVGNAYAIRCVGKESVPISKAELPVDVGKEEVGRTLVGPIHASFNLMPSPNVIPVVLSLPGVHDSLLGKVGGCSKTQIVSRIVKGHVGKTLVELARLGNCITNAVSAEPNIQPAIGDTGFIHHAAAKIVGPARKHGLAQCRLIERISSRGALGSVVQVGKAIAVIDVTSNDRILGELEVGTGIEIVDVIGGRKKARNSAEFSCRARRYHAGCEIAAHRISSRYTKCPKLAHCGDCLCTSAGRKATSQSGQSARCRSKTAAGERAVCTDHLLVEPAGEEPLVLHEGSAQSHSSELIIHARWFGQRIPGCIHIKILLKVGHGIEDRIVYVSVNAAMPRVAARFRDYVHHRTRIASVFRPELVGNQNVLVDPLGIRHEQAWAGYAVVVVVLTINLLIVV